MPTRGSHRDSRDAKVHPKSVTAKPSERKCSAAYPTPERPIPCKKLTFNEYAIIKNESMFYNINPLFFCIETPPLQITNGGASCCRRPYLELCFRPGCGQSAFRNDDLPRGIDNTPSAMLIYLCKALREFREIISIIS